MMIKPISPGLTLIELMITLLISVILICLTTPFVKLLDQDYLIINQQRLFTALQFAKIEAMSHQVPINIQSTNWNEGLTISRENEDTPLRFESFDHVHITLSAYPQSYNNKVIQFTPDGKCLSNGTFAIYALKSKQLHSEIIFNQAGRIRIKQIALH